MEYCICEKLKEEAKRGTAIVHSDVYSAYYIKDVELGKCPHEHEITEVRIYRCPWCGKRL